jgi:hypothetical protein
VAKPYGLESFSWKPGEELIYSVKWTFIKLGEIKLTIVSEDTLNGRKVYHCQISIDSRPGLPFVNVHDMYESYIDAAEIYSHRFLSYESKGNYVLFTRYNFDYDKNEVNIRIEKRWEDATEIILDSTGVIPEKVEDSLSMLFFARALSQEKKEMYLPVFVYNKFEYTQLRFSGRMEELKVKGQKYKGFYLEGRLKFVGIAGVKEDFKGWFSSDPQHIPLKASMKAFIGSVKLELIKWKHWKGESSINKNR